MTIVQNPYRLAREVENDALAQMTAPSPREEGWDEGYAAMNAMNALLSEQLEEARQWHYAAVMEKRAAQADAERLFTALDGYIMARITGTDLRDYDDLAERAVRAHRSLAATAAERERIVRFLREPRDSADVNLSLAIAADLIERGGE